jgi:hypothetical protein
MALHPKDCMAVVDRSVNNSTIIHTFGNKEEKIDTATFPQGI